MAHDNDGSSGPTGLGEGHDDRHDSAPLRPLEPTSEYGVLGLGGRSLDDDGPATQIAPVARVALTERKEYVHLGPIPSPSDLAAYGEISPDLIERILSLAERNQNAALERDAATQRAEAMSRRVEVGAGSFETIFGSLFPYACLIVSALLARYGSEVIAGITAVTALASISPKIFAAARKPRPKKAGGETS